MTARERFRALVKATGGSVATARALRISRSYVDMIRDGHRRPGLRTAFKIERLSDGKIRMAEWIASDAPAST